MWEHRGKVAAVGVGFSELYRKPLRPLGVLAVEAAQAAVEDAGLSLKDIDGLATFPPAPFVGAGNMDGVHVVTCEYMMTHLKTRPINWFGQVSTGMIPSAVIEAANAVIAGAAEYVLVWRAMYIPDGTYGAWTSRYAPGDSQFTAPYGFATPLQQHGLSYRRYMDLYGATRRHMATLAVTSRAHANRNPRAIWRNRDLTVEDYLDARMIADPLCLFDCDVPVQGCAAIVLTSSDRARALRRKPAYIVGYGQNVSSSPSPIVYTLTDYMETGGALARILWNTSGLTPRDVDVAQLYDGFSPSVYYWLESLGFCKRGEAFEFIQDGRISLTGELPLNTAGGSLSEGRLHGMGHLAEAINQVTDEAGERQVAGAGISVVADGSPMLRGAGIVFSREP